MNILATVFLLIVASLVSQAAVTITVTPATSGTNFSVTQTSPITLIDLSPNHTSGISIAPSAMNQEPTAEFFMTRIPTILGTFSTQFDDVEVQVTGYSYFHDSDNSLYRPYLDCNWFIDHGPFVIKSDQLQQDSNTPSTIAIDFSEFVPGTHVSTDPVWGEITTVVIPEPECLLLCSIGSCSLLKRRRIASAALEGSGNSTTTKRRD